MKDPQCNSTKHFCSVQTGERLEIGDIRPREADINDSLPLGRQNCQRRSCLKWDTDGKLSPLDHVYLIELLMQADPELQQDDHCELSCDRNASENAKPLYRRGHGY